MTRVLYSEKSLEDLAAIFEYVAKRNPGAAEKLGRGLIDVCNLIGNYPELGSQQDQISPGLRQFSHRNYAIYYRIRDNAVRITRFLHHAQDAGRQSFDESISLDSTPRKMPNITR